MDNCLVTFWYVPLAKMKRGQGKRINGMVTGGMSAHVSFANRIDTTIGEMRGHADNITQKTIRVNFKDVLMFIKNKDLSVFLKNPNGFILTEVQKRVADTSKTIG